MQSPSEVRLFFERDHQAGWIRNICLAALDDPISARIATGWLGVLGIAPEMHVVPDDDPEWDAKISLLTSNPLLAAQYAGGQVLSYLERTQVLHRGGVVSAEDHIATEEGSVVIGPVELGGAREQASMYLPMLENLRSLLGAEAGPSVVYVPQLGQVCPYVPPPRSA